MKLLAREKPLWTGSAAVFPFSKKLLDQFTLTTRFDDEYQLCKVFEEGGKKYIAVPRGCVGSYGEDLRSEGCAVNFTSHFKPRNEDQERLVQESTALLKNDVSHVLCAATGIGKTIIGCEVAARIGKRTLVIVTKQDILQQWIDAAKIVLGMDESQIGVIGDGKCTSVGKSLVIGLIHSVAKGPERFGEAPFAGFGLVIVDEIHRLGAETFSQCMWHLPAKLRFGLSATPHRKDGKDPVFQSHVGPTLVYGEVETMIPKVFMVRSSWKMPVRFRDGRVQPIPHSAGKVGHIVKLMGRDQVRNTMMVNLIMQAHKAGRNLIVFSESMEILHTLYDLLVVNAVPMVDIGYYVGLQFYKGSRDQKQKQREDAKYKPIVLATYQMASEATNIPALDSCLLATPRSDVVQIVGRIRREHPGKKKPVVFDMCDLASPVFEGYARRRSRWYHSIGAEIVMV